MMFISGRKIGDLSESDLKKFIQLIPQIVTGSFHNFSLVAITNLDGKFLQLYDERWKCWMFPYFRSGDANKENVDKSTSELLKFEVVTTYVAHSKHCKYSVSDDVYKNYINCH